MKKLLIICVLLCSTFLKAVEIPESDNQPYPFSLELLDILRNIRNVNLPKDTSDRDNYSYEYLTQPNLLEIYQEIFINNLVSLEEFLEHHSGSYKYDLPQTAHIIHKVMYKYLSLSEVGGFKPKDIYWLDDNVLKLYQSTDRDKVTSYKYEDAFYLYPNSFKLLEILHSISQMNMPEDISGLRSMLKTLFFKPQSSSKGKDPYSYLKPLLDDSNLTFMGRLARKSLSYIDPLEDSSYFPTIREYKPFWTILGLELKWDHRNYLTQLHEKFFSWSLPNQSLQKILQKILESEEYLYLSQDNLFNIFRELHTEYPDLLENFLKDLNFSTALHPTFVASEVDYIVRSLNLSALLKIQEYKFTPSKTLWSN